MKRIGALFVIVVASLILLTGQTALAQDLVVLSHRFDEGSFSSEIIGEIMNNDTRPYDKFDIDIYANFRDPTGALMASEQGFIDAQTLGVGQSSAFNIFLLDSEIPETTTTYDLIVNDDRLVIGQPLSGESSSDNNGDDSDNGNDNGNGSGSNNDNNDDQDSDQEIRTVPVLPYCDQVDESYTGNCHDRRDFDDRTGLFPCNDGTQEEDWRDCPDVSDPIESEPEDLPQICIPEDLECVRDTYPPFTTEEPEAEPIADEPIEQEIEPELPVEDVEESESEEPEEDDESDDQEDGGEAG